MSRDVISHRLRQRSSASHTVQPNSHPQTDGRFYGYAIYTYLTAITASTVRAVPETKQLALQLSHLQSAGGVGSNSTRI